MNNCYCTCFCDSTYRSYREYWEPFMVRQNAFSLIDTQGKEYEQKEGMVLYDEPSIRKNLNFNQMVSKRHYWNSMGNRNIIWFYAHIRMMNFYISHPNYDFYWFFDDDVKCDDFDSMFNSAKYDSDFLSFFVFKHPRVSDQSLVPIIDDKTYSKESWFDRFPGDNDVMPTDVKSLFGSFFPVVRFSNLALKKLLELNNDGYHGYSEGFVPTTLNHLGLTLDTLFSPDGTSRHFDVTSIKITHKNSTINWSWI